MASCQIPLIEHDFIFAQQAPVFVEKRFLPVVLHLALDVFDQTVLVAIRHRERPITILPAFSNKGGKTRCQGENKGVRKQRWKTKVSGTVVLS